MKRGTLAQLIEDRSCQNADKIFVTERSGEQLVSRTYAQLKTDVDKLALYLRLHVGTGEKIALAGENSYQWILVYLAVIYSGNIILPLDYRLLETEENDLLRMMQVSLLFVQDKYASEEITNETQCQKILMASGGQGDLDEILSQKIMDSSVCFTESVQETDICTILFTSGTTSKRKGVVLTQGQIYSNICSLCARMDETTGKRGYGVLPLFHAFALLCDLWRTIYLGTSFYVLGEMKYFFRELTVYEPDYMFLVPEIAESILKELKRRSGACPDRKTEKLRDEVLGRNLSILISGGAALPPSLVEEFEKAGVMLLRGYGMTECSPVIAVLSHKEHVDNRTVGKPLDCNEVQIQDGEICVRGKNVMLGYYQDPEATSEILREGWLHTGDMGYLSEEGYLYVTGRKKEMIVLKNGENVSPAAPESLLREKDVVSDALVYSYTDAQGEELRAIFEVENGMEEKVREIVDQYNREQPCCRKIRRYDCADGVISKTATGKRNRRESLKRFLLQMIRKQIEDCINDLVLTPVKLSEEMRLYEDLELDSFEMVRLAGSLEDVFHIELELQKVSAFLTVNDVCTYILEQLYQIDGTGVVCHA